jgi:hypothetical protein
MLSSTQKFEYATIAFDTTAFLIGSKLDHAAFNQKLNEYGGAGMETRECFRDESRPRFNV